MDNGQRCCNQEFCINSTSDISIIEGVMGNIMTDPLVNQVFRINIKDTYTETLREDKYFS